MRNGIIASAVAVLIIAGTAIYRLVDGSTPFRTGPARPITVEAPKLDEVHLAAASPDGPRVPRGNLIIIRPPPEPDIVTGSVRPRTAKRGQAAKAKTQKQAPPQAYPSNAPARKQAQPRRRPNAPTTDVTMATPFIGVSTAE